MARTTSIDVARVDLLKRLKERVKEIPKAVTDYEAANKAYLKEVEDWVTSLANDQANFKTVRPSYYHGESSVTIEFTTKALKGKPKYAGPEQPLLTGYSAKEAVREIQNTINILELSKAEYVGVAIMNKVAAYL